jgi:hypothetical protein
MSVELKSKEEILILVHNEVLDKLVRSELDIAFFEALLLTVPPGKEAVEIQQQLVTIRKVLGQQKIMDRKINEMLALVKKEEKRTN